MRQNGGSVRVLRGWRGHSACCRSSYSMGIDPALTVLWPQDGSPGLHGPGFPQHGQTGLGHQSARSPRTAAHWCPRESRRGSIWPVRAAAFARCDLGGDYPPRDGLAAPQLPQPRRGPDDHAEPAAADIPAAGTDVEPGELTAAQPPLILGMHDARQSSQVGSCSSEPPRGNQDLRWSQDAHPDSMGMGSARWPPVTGHGPARDHMRGIRVHGT